MNFTIKGTGTGTQGGPINEIGNVNNSIYVIYMCRLFVMLFSSFFCTVNYILPAVVVKAAVVEPSVILLYGHVNNH